MIHDRSPVVDDIAGDLASFMVGDIDALEGTKSGALAGISVLTDPSLKTDLSPPILAIATGLDQGLGIALGLGKSLTEAGTDVLANLAGEAIGALTEAIGAGAANIIGDMITEIPVIGQIVGSTIKFVQAVLGFTSGLSGDQMCQELFAFYSPPQSGSLLSGGAGVPADIFARVINLHSVLPSGLTAPFFSRGARISGVSPPAWIYPGDNLYRSAFGMAMMQITEGYPVAVEDIRASDWTSVPSGGAQPWEAYDSIGALMANVSRRVVKGDGIEHAKTYGDLFGTKYAKAFSQSLRDDCKLAAASWRKGIDPAGGESWDSDGHPKKRGLPPSWRLRFMRLRRGIQSAYGVAGGDGGVGLWLIYIDLITQAFSRGYLSESYVRFLFYRMADRRYNLSYAVGTLNDWISTAPALLWGKDPCPALVARLLITQANTWHNTVYPHYAQGKAQIDALLSQAKAVAKKAAQPASVPAVVAGLRDLLGGRP